MSSAFSHFQTITRHRHRVIAHCFRAGLLWRGLLHDLSKYSLTEFLPGARYYQGQRSPNEAERESLGYSAAWLHHKGRNRHHFEYWVDYNQKTKQLTPVPMPDVFLYEMFCDRVAASKIYQGSAYRDSHPLAYFLNAKATRVIHPQTSERLEQLLRMLAEEGEDAVFRYIRAQRKKERKIHGK